MIDYVEGDILYSTAQVLVCPVNTMGAMGAGLAKQFKKSYPKMYKAYQTACYVGDLCPGKVWFYENTDYDITLCFPTKYDYALPSTFEIIQASFDDFHNQLKTRNIDSIAFPKLGCGLGELSWSDVKPIMESNLQELSERIMVEIYV